MNEMKRMLLEIVLNQALNELSTSPIKDFEKAVKDNLGITIKASMRVKVLDFDEKVFEQKSEKSEDTSTQELFEKIDLILKDDNNNK